MFTWWRNYQANKARHIVVEHLCLVRDTAASMERTDRKCGRPVHNIAYYLGEVDLHLDTRRLQRLLHTDGDGVATWANQFHQSVALIGCHGLQLVLIPNEFSTAKPHRLAMAPQAATQRVVSHH